MSATAVRGLRPATVGWRWRTDVAHTPAAAEVVVRHDGDVARAEERDLVCADDARWGWWEALHVAHSSSTFTHTRMQMHMQARMHAHM